jgi:stage V sporulation protein SpoVS
MVFAGEITETKALAIARGYFHDNTAKLFGLPTLPGPN